MCEIALCPRECRPRFFLLSHDVVLDRMLAVEFEAELRDVELALSPPMSICITVSFLVLAAELSQLCVRDAGKMP